MALFGFKKKKKEVPEPSPFEGIGAEMVPPPVDRVLALQQQGLTNEQIVATLQREGFQLNKIMDAMSQATAAPPAGPPLPEAEYVPGPAEFPSAMAAPGAPAEISAAPAYAAVPPTESFEEIAESIIEEKWRDLSKEHSKMGDWRDETTSRLDKLEQSVADLKLDLNNLHKAIVGKIGDYDKSLLDVGTELKAMEKVFQKVLPTLTENVAELSRITGKVKKAKKKK